MIVAPDHDPDLDALIKNSGDAEDFMSEVRTYPEPMPEKIRFRVQSGNRLAGEAMLKSIRWNSRKAEISIYLLPAFRKAGIGRTVLERLLEYLFVEIDFHRAEAEIYAYNRASVRLARSAGFTEEGRLREARFYQGSYYDILRFGLLRREHGIRKA